MTISGEKTREGRIIASEVSTLADEFVKKITDKLKKVDDDARLKSESALQNAETIEAHAPQQWQALREWVRQFCEDANRQMEGKPFTFRVVNNQELIVDTKIGAHSRLLQAAFNNQTKAIAYDSMRHTFKPHIDDAGNFTFTDAMEPP
jgi:hypothetical protein